MKKSWRIKKLFKIGAEIEEEIQILQPKTLNDCCRILTKFTEAVEEFQNKEKSKKWRRRAKRNNLKGRRITKIYKNKTKKYWWKINTPTWEDTTEELEEMDMTCWEDITEEDIWEDSTEELEKVEMPCTLPKPSQIKTAEISLQSHANQQNNPNDEMGRFRMQNNNAEILQECPLEIYLRSNPSETDMNQYADLIPTGFFDIKT